MEFRVWNCLLSQFWPMTSTTDNETWTPWLKIKLALLISACFHVVQTSCKPCYWQLCMTCPYLWRKPSIITQRSTSFNMVLFPEFEESFGCSLVQVHNNNQTMDSHNTSVIKCKGHQRCFTKWTERYACIEEHHFTYVSKQKWITDCLYCNSTYDLKSMDADIRWVGPHSSSGN